MFRDGSLYSQWMDRMYDNDLQVSGWGLSG